MSQKLSGLTREAEQDKLANPVLVSRQIDTLREVIRRMKASRSGSFDALIDKKLEQVGS